ncbi:MAG: methionine--tRNA ligase [Candidatus Hydrothermarchaeales archaeon]
MKITEKILITCALPYVNNVPHIGNIAGSHLPGDIFARFCRLFGYETLYIGGSDEHGTPIEVAAEKLGISPKELSAKYYEVHKEIYDWLDISYDNFSRTSLKLHHETTEQFFLKVYENGFISEATIRLPYCERDKRVLPDRYVEGTCPICGYEHARGDQCEMCSNLLNPDELKEPRCSLCGTRPVMREVKHLFLGLDKLQRDLEKWIKSNEKIWSSQVVTMAMGWIREGLKPRCITRDIKWGVKVPIKGYEDKVLYVWFDAPIGYVSSTKEWAAKKGMPEEWRKFWQGDAKIFHFIGKDNIPFHTIFWPGMLMANGDYTLPYRVVGLQYLNYEGGKISKSRNWGVFCENLSKTGLSSDIWRFYLAMLIPETDDTEWKWNEFRGRINNELVANLGNFIYRTMSFIKNNFNGVVPEASLTKEDEEVLKLGEEYAGKIKELAWDIRLRDALRKVLELSDKGNKYFQENEPWKSVKEDNGRAATTVYVCANLCYDLAILMSPFMPQSAYNASQQLGVPLGKLDDVGKRRVKGGQKLGDVEILFPKLKEEDLKRLKEVTSKVTEYEEMFTMVNHDDFQRLDLRVAKVLEVEHVKDSDKLLKLTIDVGGTKKQIVAGISQHYTSEELVGKNIIVVNNLKTALIKGEKSEGMLLATDSEGKIVLLTTDREVKSGSKVS